MNIFGSSDTVGGKARSILGDLPDDPSPYEIFQAVDQKAGDDVDPDDVVLTMRELDEEVDAKLATIEGEDVDQKEMRAAAGTVAARSDMSQGDAMEMLSAITRGDLDQAALTDDTTNTDMGNESDTSDPDSGTDSDPDPDAGAADDGGVDQKQEDEDNNSDSDGPLDMLNDDARETVEEFAKLAGKDPEECVQEVLGVGGADEQPTADMAAGGDKPGHDRNMEHDQMSAHDQKLEDLNLNERIAEAVTSDEVIDAMAGEVAQKMAADDDFADSLVKTVDQKGDFVTTDDTVVTAPSGESETVGDAGAITGGDSE